MRRDAHTSKTGRGNNTYGVFEQVLCFEAGIFGIANQIAVCRVSHDEQIMSHIIQPYSVTSFSSSEVELAWASKDSDILCPKQKNAID